jgi:purine-cytosine permease-like protein
MSAPITSSPAAAPQDQFGHIEARGIDYIPPAERHGQAHELFAVWTAPNVTYLYIVLGGALVGLGLNAWEGIGIVLLGNLFWVLVGLLSVSGPASGTPSSVVMRAMFGIRGNRVNLAITGWGIAVAYEAINLSVGSLAGFALLATLGIKATALWKFAIVIATAVVTLAISVYGHATIVKLSGIFTAALTVCCVLLAYFVAPHVNMHFVPQGAPQGGALLAAALAGLTIIASGPLSWGTGADFPLFAGKNVRPGDHLLGDAGRLSALRRTRDSGRAGRHGGGYDQPADLVRHHSAGLVLPGVFAGHHVRLDHQQHPHRL